MSFVPTAGEHEWQRLYEITQTKTQPIWLLVARRVASTAWEINVMGPIVVDLLSNRVEASAKVTPENCQAPRHLNSPTTTGVLSRRSTSSLFFNTTFCARFPVHTPVEPVSHCHSHSHEFDHCSGLPSLAVMVKVTEDWLTVEDGTKLYTKTWEVGHSHLLSLWL